MKHITILIALTLILGALTPLAAQTKMTAKEKRTQTRQERKITQQKNKRAIIPRCCSCFRKQHVCTGSRSTDFQTR